MQECDKKEADCELSAKTSRERYQAKCREMGIKVGSMLYLCECVQTCDGFVSVDIPSSTIDYLYIFCKFGCFMYSMYVCMCIRTYFRVNTNTVGPTESGHIVNHSWNVLVGKHTRRTHRRYALLDENANLLV